MKSYPPLTALILLIASTASQAAVSTLSASMNVDNVFTAYITTNDSIAGTVIGSGVNWPTTYSFSTPLTPGVTNYLHISGLDQGGLAGFLGQFSLSDTQFEFPNGGQSQLTNTVDWEGNSTGYGNSYDASLTNLGNNGVSPWGNIPAIGAATWIWSGNSNSNNASYFSLAITPTTPSNVPDGGSTVALLGLAMTAVAGARKKFGI